MGFIDNIKERARKSIKTIVLPESEDIRTLKGAEIVIREKFAKIILLGNEEEIKKLASENNVSLDGIEIIQLNQKNQTNIHMNYMNYEKIKE